MNDDIGAKNANIKSNRITCSELKECLHYDENSGVFTWIKTMGLRGKKGTIAGSKNKCGYVGIKINRVLYRAHRLAWLYVTGSHPENEIDHINGNRSDNRIQNLRDVTKQINAQNIKRPSKNNSVGLLGVSVHKKTGKYRAVISIRRKSISLGLFDRKEDAAEAYMTAKMFYHYNGVGMEEAA